MKENGLHFHLLMPEAAAGLKS